MSPRWPYFQALVFFCAAFAIVVLLEVALLVFFGELSGRRFSPRGLGWFVVPFVSGCAGWAFGKSWGYESIARAIGFRLETANFEKRLWIAGSTLYGLIVGVVFLVFDPFDRYRWYTEEWTKFLTIILGPPIVTLLAIVIYRWAAQGRKT